MQLEVAKINKKENISWWLRGSIANIIILLMRGGIDKMSFGQNLQFLRKMRNGMTQEELAEIMGVSRQTVSKWELDATYPEMEKMIELCQYFSCSMDQLVRENINVGNEAYSDM